MRRPNRPPPVIQTVGPRVRKLRQKAGLTVKELAVRSRIDRADLSRLETSSGPKNFGVERLNLIAAALGVPVAALFQD